MAAHAAPAVPAPGLPRGLAACRRFLRAVGRVELVLAIVALLVVVGLSSAQSLLRYTFGTSLWWAQEVAENSIMVSYFLGASYLFKTRQYILVDFLSKLAPLRVQMGLYVLAQVLTAYFAIEVVRLIYVFSATLLNMDTPVLRLPAIVTILPLLAASAMIALTSAYYLAFGVWALATGAKGATVEEIERRALIDEPLEEPA